MNIRSYIHMISHDDTKKVVEVAGAFRLLSDPTRFKILCCLIENSEGMCVYELAEEVGVSHSAMSHQLGRLEDKGLVSSFRDGQSVCYQLLENTFTDNIKKVIKIFDRS